MQTQASVLQKHTLSALKCSNVIRQFRRAIHVKDRAASQWHLVVQRGRKYNAL
jgi:hypothetical protein